MLAIVANVGLVLVAHLFGDASLWLLLPFGGLILGQVLAVNYFIALNVVLARRVRALEKAQHTHAEEKQP